MKKFGKKLAMLGLVATMSIVGAMSSFALALDYSPSGSVVESESDPRIDVELENGYTIKQVPIRTVHGKDIKFTVKEDSIPMGKNYRAEFIIAMAGYVENGKLVLEGGQEDYGNWPVNCSLFDFTDPLEGKVCALVIHYYTGNINDNGEDETNMIIWLYQFSSEDTSKTTTDTNTIDNTNTDSNNNSYTQGWRQNATGWWYQYSDGSYVKNNWFQDVDGKWYYFNNDGYMLANTTTPDGYYVNVSGVWVKDYLSVSSNSKKIYGQYVCEQYMEEDHDTIVVLTFLEFYENMSDVAILEVQTKNKGYFNDAHFKYQDGSVCLTETSSVYNDLAGYWSEEQIFFDGGDKVNVGENTYTRIADGYQRNGYNFPRVYE